MFTAIVEITRNGARAARGLTSIQSRLTQVLDDQSSTGKALLDIYQGLGIELFDSEGQIRSLYDILSDLSKQWETLDTNTKDYIALEQAGANQTQNFMALMNNFGTAVSATATAYDSLGSAAEENEAVINSLQGKTAQLRATFQDFANDVLSREMLGNLLELANGLLKIGDSIPNIVTQSTLLAGVLGPMGALLSKFYLGPVLGISANLGPIGIALGVVVPLALQLFNAWKEAHPTFEDATKQLETLNGQLEHNRDRLKEIDALPWNERTTAILNERDALQEENDKLEEQIALYEKRKKAAAISEAESGHTVIGSVYEVRYKDRQKGMQTREFSDYETAAQYAKTYGGSLRELTKEIELSGDALSDFLSKGLTEVNKQLEKSGTLSSETAEWWGRNEAAAREYYDSLKNIDSSVRELTEAEVEFIAQFDQMNLQQKVDALIQSYPELSNVISLNNGQLSINGEKLKEMEFASEESRVALANLIAQETVFNKTGLSVQQQATALLQLAMAAGVASDAMILLREAEKGDARAGQAIVARYGSLENYYNQLIGSVSKVNVAISGNPTGSGGGGVVGATTKVAKATKELADTTKEASDATKELEKYLKAEEDRLKGVVSALEDKISAYEILFGYLQDQIDVEIDALEAQKQALQDQNEELQTQVELEEKLDALARAKSQETMVYRNGRFQYVSDIDETSKAQADLEKYYRNQEYQAQLDAIDAQIQALENQKKQIDIGQEQIKQEQNLAKVVDQLGVDFTNGWRDIYDDLDVYLSGYKDSLADLEKYTDDIENLQQENIDYSKLWWEAYESGASQETLDAIHQLEVQRRAEAGDNSIYDPATGTWSDSGTSFKPASDETDSKGRPVSGVGSNQYNYLTDLLANGTEGQKAWARSELAAGHYQSGTTNARGGFSLVGEKGAELRVLNQGDGILPADITKNLWAWGSLTPATLVNALGGLGSSKMMSVSIANLNLPEVRDGEGFVNYMKNNFWRSAVQTNFNR